MAEPPQTNPIDNIFDSDNLTALPDCVLLQILSLLDTKEAAATSILCTRWRNLFLSLPDVNLRFCVNNNGSDSDPDGSFHLFTLFANRVFQQRNNEPIRKIQLYVKHFVESFQLGFESLLMSTAAAISSYKVQYLEIVVEMDRSTTEPCSVTLPTGLFSSESLVSLHLSLHSSEYAQLGWHIPEFVWLPNLKDLNLTSFRLVDENCIQRILYSCPLLERLVLIPRSLDESEVEEGVHVVEALHLSSSSLKRLILCWDEKVNSVFNVFVKSESLERLTCCMEGLHKISIDAPNLKSLCIHGHVLEVHINQSLDSINVAVIRAEFLFHLEDVEDMFSRTRLAFKFFSGLQHVKALTLSENIMKALYFCPPVMPIFRNLIKLELIPDYCHYFPRYRILQVLLNLFKSSPNLEVLTFREVFDNYFGKDEEFDYIFPLTFVEHLKVIEMNNFKGSELEFKVVEHFLKNGKSLEKIVLERKGWRSIWKHRKRILSFEKCSKNCQIVFRKK
ncbi:hypothetical protein VNO78_16010 [Psophocarpus tetragonolobus]|uniref:F-box domain-containing protein n=1 Tax=Psophocarpus tetragonolobus TaxID=3891 RepID=A0AAN9SGE3_PSOTE